MTHRDPILVVEDNAVNRMVLGLLLDGLNTGYEIAEDGARACQSVRSKNYSLILMDIMMPVMDGFQASLEIRKHEFKESRHTPIIACTAMDEDKIFEQCVRCGINDYLPKPIDRNILKEKINHWSIITTLKPLDSEIAEKLKRLENECTTPIDRNYLNLLYGLQQLEDVLELFLTVTGSLLDQLESAIGNRDVAVVRRMAHEIKGSSFTVSAREMARLCLDLERASDDQDWPAAEKLYTALGLAFARVKEFLENKEDILKAI